MDRQVYFSGGKALIGSLSNPGGSLADGDYVAPFALVVENGVVTRVEQSWVSDIYYTQDSLVLGSDCQLYRAVQASGPSSVAQDPTTDASDVYWTIFTSPVYPVWSPTVTYGGAGQSKFVEGSDGNIYRSQQAANTGHDPTLDNGTWWSAFYVAANTTLNVGHSSRFTTIGSAVDFVKFAKIGNGTVTISVAPSGSVVAISNATNASPIVITSTAHGLLSGNEVYISGVQGNTAANGHHTVTVIDPNSYSLNGSTGNGAYTSGGNGVRCYLETGSTNLTNVDFRRLKITGAGSTSAFVAFPADVSGMIVSGVTVSEVSGLRLISNWNNVSQGVGQSYGVKGLNADAGGVIVSVTDVRTDKFYYGFAATRFSYMAPTGCRADASGDVGFWSYNGSHMVCTTCASNTAKDTTGTNTLGAGFTAEHASMDVDEGCTTDNNWIAGYYVSHGDMRVDAATGSSNNAAGSVAHGLHVTNCGRVSIRGTCAFSSNTGDGVRIDPGGTLNSIGIYSLACSSNNRSGIRNEGGQIIVGDLTTSSNSRFGIEVGKMGRVWIGTHTASGNAIGATGETDGNALSVNTAPASSNQWSLIAQ